MSSQLSQLLLLLLLNSSVQQVTSRFTLSNLCLLSKRTLPTLQLIVLLPLITSPHNLTFWWTQSTNSQLMTILLRFTSPKTSSSRQLLSSRTAKPQMLLSSWEPVPHLSQVFLNFSAPLVLPTSKTNKTQTLPNFIILLLTSGTLLLVRLVRINPKTSELSFNKCWTSRPLPKCTMKKWATHSSTNLTEPNDRDEYMMIKQYS